MPTIIAILIIVVGVINMLRLVPKPKEQDPGAATESNKHAKVQQ